MFEKEANGLEQLREACRFIIPQVIKHGSCDDQQYLLLEWLEKGTPAKDMWENFGAGLATMHRQAQPYFGNNEDNYIGSLEQINTRSLEWHSFYTECRIMPLVKKLVDAGTYSLTDMQAAGTFCNQLKDLFPPESPALLHGDLWAGNYLITSSGDPAIYDPAVYFGHREMDLGMSKLFGGFDRGFYDSYNATYPLEKNWQERLPFTQLYPLLVHAILFGGHYVAATRNIFSSFQK